ncbi:MAG: hypothetical protein SVR94_15370 [Pseudomonadota bacterium]|nr:hypothetical protein [Pseudomonadota bacterium]
MNAYVLAKEIDKLLFLYLDPESWLIKTLYELIYLDPQSNTYLLDFEIFLRKLLKSNSFFADKFSKLRSTSNELNENIDRLQKRLKKISAKELFPRLAQLEHSLHVVSQCLQQEALVIKTISNSVSRFSSAFDTYLEFHTYDATIHVFLTAVELENNIKFLKNILHLIRDNLEIFQTQEHNDTALSLLFANEVEFKQFVEKLIAIHMIYEELGQLLNRSLDESPIRLVKVKAGSLWVKVTGEAQVISLMRSLLESSALYIYRNDTPNGTLMTLPRELESLDKVLHLSKRLEEQGINTTTTHDHIQKASISLARQLNILFEGQHSLEINNTEYSIKNSSDNNLLPLKKPFTFKQSYNVS